MCVCRVNCLSCYILAVSTSLHFFMKRILSKMTHVSILKLCLKSINNCYRQIIMFKLLFRYRQNQLVSNYISFLAISLNCGLPCSIYTCAGFCLYSLVFQMYMNYGNFYVNIWLYFTIFKQTSCVISHTNIRQTNRCIYEDFFLEADFMYITSALYKNIGNWPVN